MHLLQMCSPWAAVYVPGRQGVQVKPLFERVALSPQLPRRADPAGHSTLSHVAVAHESLTAPLPTKYSLAFLRVHGVQKPADAPPHAARYSPQRHGGSSRQRLVVHESVRPPSAMKYCPSTRVHGVQLPFE